jgi:hydrogenase maturation protein HypF
MIAGGLNSPPGHGVGRAFDAAGALALARPHSRHEGQVAVALDNAAQAGPAAASPYPFEIDVAAGLSALDLRPLWRALAADVAAGVPPGAISARFHAALAAGGADLVRRAADERGRLPVVLTGGCFQNASLAEGIARELGSGFEVYQHGQVPPGDGGIALGQAIVADAVSGGARTS